MCSCIHAASYYDIIVMGFPSIITSTNIIMYMYIDIHCRRRGWRVWRGVEEVEEVEGGEVRWREVEGCGGVG